MTQATQNLDLIGIGIGPSNLSMAALLYPLKQVRSRFFDCKKEFEWYPGMLFPEATIQVSFLKDLTTLVDPMSKFTFLAFLAEKKRLYRFAMAQFPKVKRREFNQYFQWVCKGLHNLQFDTTVTEVSFDDGVFTVRHSMGEARAKNIVLASGQTAKVPEFVRPHLCSTVFHAIQFNQENITTADKKIAVIGGGQSGAEVFNRLLSCRSELPRELCWITKRPNFLPIDDSPFTNEFFTPSYSNYFYHLPAEEKRTLINQQMLASDGINLDILESIYRNLYEIELIEGKGKIANLQLNSSLIDFMKTGEGWTLVCRNGSSGDIKTFYADIVIFATGFEYKPPKFLDGLMHRLESTESGFAINEDFSIQWDGPADNHIYIQNAARHVRGVADPNLSLIAWRSAKIINSLVGNRVYDIDDHSSAFSWPEVQNETEFQGSFPEEPGVQALLALPGIGKNRHPG